MVQVHYIQYVYTWGRKSRKFTARSPLRTPDSETPKKKKNKEQIDTNGTERNQNRKRSERKQKRNGKKCRPPQKAIPGGAYVVSNQNPRLDLKIMYSPMFTHHIWFWLLCSPVIADIDQSYTGSINTIVSYQYATPLCPAMTASGVLATTININLNRPKELKLHANEVSRPEHEKKSWQQKFSGSGRVDMLTCPVCIALARAAAVATGAAG